MIPLVDLRAQYHSIKDEIDKAVSQVIESGQFILGPNVKALEEEIAAYCGTDHAVGVGSGTEALHLSLLALGIGAGDEVITTPFTFFATSEAISQTGANPVFVDIDPITYNINPSQIEEKIGSKTVAILPVHLYGQPADMEEILAIARRNDLLVVEDCAQAIGAEYRGRKVGSLGDAGCLSFFPSKNLGGYGDGGMVVTDNAETAEKLRMLRTHGSLRKYYHSLLGFNSRLDEIQAAVLRVKLKYIDQWNGARQGKADIYNRLLAELPLARPAISPERTHVYNQYTIRVIERDLLQKTLGRNGISTAIYYPLPLHLQMVYENLGYSVGSLPGSERGSREVLSLPMYPELEDSQVEHIVDVIGSVLLGTH
jgi:dTDP-4-amino-4,6-dideoxygalactose transaminase